MRRVHIILLLIVIFLIFLALLVTLSPNSSISYRIGAIFLGFLGSMAAVAEIMGLLDRVGIPETINPSEQRFVDIQNEQSLTTVALWGPVASGKSWLIHALERTLREKYCGSYQGLDFKTQNNAIKNDKDISHAPPATEDISDSILKFERQIVSNEFNKSMNNFTHTIRIVDNRGGSTIEVLNQNNEEISGYLHETLFNLANADIVIIALDPCQLFPSSLAESSLMSKKEYAQMVRKLFSILEKANPKKQRLYAVCITKADVIVGSMFVHPNALVESFFGAEMSKVLEIPPSGTLSTFTTSSFGFLPETTKVNFSPFDQEIIDKENWQPYGVEYPFFWAFELKEREMLENVFKSNIYNKIIFRNKIKEYIPYPKPKFEI